MHFDFSRQRINTTLEIMLWYAVCRIEDNDKHIAIINSMDEEYTNQLMYTVQEHQMQAETCFNKSKCRKSADFEGLPTRNGQQNLNNLDASGELQVSILEQDLGTKFDEPLSTNALLSEPPLVAEFDNTIQRLSREKEIMGRREAELLEQLQTVTQRSLDEGIRASESERLAARLREEVASAQICHREEAQALKHALCLKEAQIAELQEKVDLNDDLEQKLAQTRKQNALYHQRIDELQGVEAELVKEEERRGNHVEEILRLKTIEESIPSLKQQIDDYKAKTTLDAQKIRALQKELELSRRATHSLETARQELELESQVCHAQTRALQSEINDLSCNGQLTDGIKLSATELGPEVKEMIVQLQHENASLINQLDRQKGQNVDRLLNEVDDAKRLANSYAEQLESTKELFENALSEINELKCSLSVVRLESSEGLKREEQLTSKLGALRQHSIEQEAQLRAQMDAKEKCAEKRQCILVKHRGAALWLQRTLWLRSVESFQALLKESQKREADLSLSLDSKKGQYDGVREECEELTKIVQKQKCELVGVRAELEQNLVLEAKAVEELRVREEATSRLVECGKQAIEKLRMNAEDSTTRHIQRIRNLELKLNLKCNELDVSKSKLKQYEEDICDLHAQKKKLQRTTIFLEEELQTATRDGVSNSRSKNLIANNMELKREVDALRLKHSRLREHNKELSNQIKYGVFERVDMSQISSASMHSVEKTIGTASEYISVNSAEK